jgi:orotate phosphoribosyltransferase
MKLSYTMFDYGNVIARDLIDIGAVDFRPDKPFTFTSGRISPIYVDVRRLYGLSDVRHRLSMLASAFIYKNIGRESFQVIAGGETAGIPIATLMADRIHKPFCYVRKAPKGFGRGAQIEGLSEEELAEGRKFLLCEDLCSDGGSKRNFIHAIRQSGNIVTDIFVPYSYGIFGAEESLAEDGIKLHSMVNAEKLVEVAEDLGAFPTETLSQIRGFIAANGDWAASPVSEPVFAHPIDSNNSESSAIHEQETLVEPA